MNSGKIAPLYMVYRAVWLSPQTCFADFHKACINFVHVLDMYITCGVSLESERDRAGIKVDEELNSVTGRQWEGQDESSNNVVMSASQFHKFMSAVMEEFEDLKDRMRSENTKLSRT